MQRAFNQLSARRVTAESKKGRYADGGGLYLQVSDSGAKSWLFRFKMDGRARQMGLGSVNTISLADARVAAHAARKLVYEGTDPIEDRKAKRNAKRLESVSEKTFQKCAAAYITSHQAGWKNTKHSAQWTSSLENHVYPEFGEISVSAVDTGLVMRVIEPIWRTHTETASRVRGRIEAILDWATVHGYRKGENPARWKGHLDKLLPKKSKVSKVNHFTALPYTEIGEFMVDLRKREGIAAIGLEFLILTAARTGEVIGAKWDEIVDDVWTIPEGRMKAGAEHRIPLSPLAVSALKRARKLSHSDYIFPGMDSKRPMSNMAFLKLIERMDLKGTTAHGFRSTFRDWAAEQTNFPREVAEMALAHTVADKVEAAYRRGDLFEKRRKLMEAWSTYVSKPKIANGAVISIRRNAND